ncbi:cryptochrome/photolyase family protein [Luteibacter sp. PPL201]|uniref:Cryptochrome/photolyase family protein n=1 Tax=Luteibacter sahnii TaxID=3021977 RepID=A0ABT6BAC4_9GAMM
MRHLVVVLGDQLDRQSHVFDDFDPAVDVVWMAERRGEGDHVWSHKARIVVFLAAMRHFAQALRDDGFPVEYTHLRDRGPAGLLERLAAALRRHRPERVVVVRPGEHRLREGLREVAQACGVALVERPDRHFMVSVDDFTQWAKGKTQLRMEHFYRWMRVRHDVLLENGKPVGGQWNYDAENRGHFGREGPGWVPAPRRFLPDDVTQAVIDDVEAVFADHPGRLDAFDWPVSRAQAKQALRDFLDHRLPVFGQWQDAMWSDHPWLYHARLSTSMNLKLLAPAEVIAAVIERFNDGKVPLASAEGFIRQVLGWREFVRGVYWLNPERLLDSNALRADGHLPDLYWTGDTDMNCMAQVVGQTLEHGYAHHIQRLMVTGNFAMLLGVEPAQVHAWYLAIYVDAIEWVEAPNTLGMSQFADGGRMVSKPYAASGRYIDRMSDYCKRCRYRPGDAVGDSACPFTTLYWDFLDRHKARFAHHPRAALQWRSLERLSREQLAAIRSQAQALRERLGVK